MFRDGTSIELKMARLNHPYIHKCQTSPGNKPRIINECKKQLRTQHNCNLLTHSYIELLPFQCRHKLNYTQEETEKQYVKVSMIEGLQKRGEKSETLR